MYRLPMTAIVAAIVFFLDRLLEAILTGIELETRAGALP